MSNQWTTGTTRSNLHEVQNKAIVVTGGANGIGRELALRLLDKGARVAAVDINEAGLQETAALASGKTERLSLHMANISSMGGFLLRRTS